jgi:superfamily I DNA/RNA helicase
VTDRKSINFDEAGERLVMGSLAAFKGKDWRAVILLDCTEGVLPSKSSVHTTKEVRAAHVYDTVIVDRGPAP